MFNIKGLNDRYFPSINSNFKVLKDCIAKSENIEELLIKYNIT